MTRWHCRQCGNEALFKRMEYRNEVEYRRTTYEVTIRGDGEWEDDEYIEGETSDSETTDSDWGDTVTCCNCDSENVIDLDEEDEEEQLQQATNMNRTDNLIEMMKIREELLRRD